MFAKFYKTSGKCTAERHVWFTATIPPDDSLKCECGKTTYGRERDNAQQKMHPTVTTGAAQEVESNIRNIG